MKTSLITVIAIILLAAKSFAQKETTTNMPSAINAAYNEAWDKQTQNLGLTTAQVYQWQALDAADLKQAQAIVVNTGLTNDERQAQLNTLYAQQQIQLTTILKPVQYSKWSAEKTAVKETATESAATARSKESNTSRPNKSGSGRKD